MPFKPGQSGNPGGQPKIPDELRGIRLIKPAIVHRVLAKFAAQTISELREASLNPELPAMDKIWIRQILLAADGDGKAVDRLMLWAVGAPTTPVDEKTGSQIALDNMTTAELLDVVRKSLPAARDLPDATPGEKDD